MKNPFSLLMLSIALSFCYCNKKDKKEEPSSELNKWKEYSSQVFNLTNSATSFQINGNIYFCMPYNNRMAVYSVANKTWNYQDLPQQFSPRNRAHVAVHNGKAYIGGGKNDNDYFFDWWEFSPQDNSWKRLEPCPAVQVYGQTFVVNGILYTGLSSASLSGEVIQNNWYKYNIAQNQWQQEPMIVDTRSGSMGSSFSINDQLYFGSGVEIQSPLDIIISKKFFRFNPESGTAQRMADLPISFNSVHNATGFSMDGKGYILSGHGSIYQYTPGSNTWQEIKFTSSDIVLPHYAHAVGDKVFGFTSFGKVYEFIYK